MTWTHTQQVVPAQQAASTLHAGIPYTSCLLTAEYNAWLLYRLVVNVILGNDLASYMALALSEFTPLGETYGVPAWRPSP